MRIKPVLLSYLIINTFAHIKFQSKGIFIILKILLALVIKRSPFYYDYYIKPII